MRIAYFLAASLLATSAQPQANPFDQFDGPAPKPAPNYATCILASMPGSPNEAFTTAVAQKCLRAHAGAFYEIELGSGIGVLSFDDPQACVLSKAATTTNQRAAYLIAASCRCLYAAPSAAQERCAYPANPR